MGLECIGEIDGYCSYEVLYLAAKSLLAISPDCVLDLSHLGFINEVFKGVGLDAAYRGAALSLIGEKNLHELMSLCEEAGLSEENARRSKKLITLYGAPEEVLPRLKETFGGICDLSSIEELEETVALFDPETRSILRIDFSVVNDVRYYNGTVFKGFVKDVPVGVLSGGRYDRLLEKFGRKAGAIGFAVYLDALERMEDLRPFDVDVLLLYGENEDFATVRMWARDLMQSGKSVQVQRAIPEDLRYQKLMKIEEGRLILLEEYA